MFSLSYLTLLFAKDFGHFALSMTVLTLGEATAFPAIPAYVNDLSPLSAKGKYQGLTMVASSLGRAFGPMFGGIVIESMGYLALFWIAAVVILLTIVCLLPLHKRLVSKLTLFK